VNSAGRPSKRSLIRTPPHSGPCQVIRSQRSPNVIMLIPKLKTPRTRYTFAEVERLGLMGECTHYRMTENAP